MGLVLVRVAPFFTLRYINFISMYVNLVSEVLFIEIIENLRGFVRSKAHF